MLAETQSSMQLSSLTYASACHSRPFPSDPGLKVHNRPLPASLCPPGDVCAPLPCAMAPSYPHPVLHASCHSCSLAWPACSLQAAWRTPFCFGPCAEVSWGVMFVGGWVGWRGRQAAARVPRRGTELRDRGGCVSPKTPRGVSPGLPPPGSNSLGLQREL